MSKKRLMKDMTEPELRFYFNSLMAMIQDLTPPDVKGFMLLMASDQGIMQYAGSVERVGGVAALRELADRIEKNDTIER